MAFKAAALKSLNYFEITSNTKWYSNILGIRYWMVDLFGWLLSWTAMIEKL
ncbi:hypothetical protein LEP1GSC198_0173 [Leptospira kirschneri str. JB]|nr:hypothetical protein LEP1GSC198_0173 [Leptospira kirschneri str. JB]